MPANLPTKPQVKLKTASILWADSLFEPGSKLFDKQDGCTFYCGKSEVADQPYLVLPFCSPATAKRALKFWRGTEEVRYKRILAEICFARYGNSYACLEVDRQQARAVLSIVCGGEKS